MHERPVSGLAITAFVLSFLSLCLSPIALVSLPMGIVGISKCGQRGTRRGLGLAIAATSISGLGLLMSCLQVGIVLPALGKARMAATRLKDQTQLREISQALFEYSSNHADVLPGPGEDWRQILLDEGYITDPDVFASATGAPAEGSFYYVPADELTFDGSQVLLYSDPDLYAGYGGLIGYHDNHVEWVYSPTFEQIVQSLTLPDGTPWAPHLDD